MRRLRLLGLATAVAVAGALLIALVGPFLAPSLSYDVKDRVGEFVSGRRGKTYRIALGSRTGSDDHLGDTLNRYLSARAGYTLELVATGGQPDNVSALLDRGRDIHLATIDSTSEATKAEDVRALAAIGRPYFFVIVPNTSPVREFREITGAMNPGARLAEQPPTLGERVLEFYGLTTPAVSIVRPAGVSFLEMLDGGTVAAASRTQFLYDGLIDDALNSGRHRLVPIRDHEALAMAIPGTEPGFIPAGVYGPSRRVPPEPVPTLLVTALIVARTDLPGRVVRDILEVIYDPRFGRDIERDLTEEAGRKVGHLTLHPAADIFYHRNDLLTSDRLGRLSFVASVVAGSVATFQFVALFRRSERRKRRRTLLSADLEKLRLLRINIEAAANDAEARALIAQADDLLCQAEQDAIADRLDQDGITTLRSLHGVCWRVMDARSSRRPDPAALGIQRPGPGEGAAD